MSRRQTEHDLLIRPTNAADSVSTAREWLYNRRSELAAANVGTNVYGYAYDSIGNRLRSSENATTNSYAANCLNQYSSVGRDVPAAPRTAIHYDADGNMTDDGEFAYSYDAENRLISIYPISPAAGSLAVENRYDHRHRRVRKVVKKFDGAAWETAETHTFVWDGGDVVLEKVEFADGTVRTCEYFWGADRSGAEQGAGGVGGLLAVSVDGAFYVPCYDHNGNVVMYVSVTGGVAAQYVYDPYGNMIESHGTLADMFAFGFSTKYHDRETGLVAYQRRFYSPALGRWLNRDPIEEDGGLNLYEFCRNNPVVYIDSKGEDIYLYTGNNSGNPLNDTVHQTIAVDIWSDDCPPKRIGVRGFSFGYDGEWGWNWPNGKWLGHSSITLPGYWMTGEIYEAPVVGKIVSTKKTRQSRIGLGYETWKAGWGLRTCTR